MKRFQGLIAAAVITLVVALGMVVIGVDAASNTNVAPIVSSPAQASLAAAAGGSSQAQADQSQAQIAQLQSLIKQYQDREKQYQSEIQSLSQKLSDASSQADQLQQILMALQQRGVIQITRDGRIFVNGG